MVALIDNDDIHIKTIYHATSYKYWIIRNIQWKSNRAIFEVTTAQTNSPLDKTTHCFLPLTYTKMELPDLLQSPQRHQKLRLPWNEGK